MAIDKFEYRELNTGSPTIEQLEELGNQAWELVAIEQASSARSNGRSIFKRKLYQHRCLNCQKYYYSVKKISRACPDCDNSNYGNRRR